MQSLLSQCETFLYTPQREFLDQTLSKAPHTTKTNQCGLAGIAHSDSSQMPPMGAKGTSMQPDPSKLLEKGGLPPVIGMIYTFPDLDQLIPAVNSQSSLGSSDISGCSFMNTCPATEPPPQEKNTSGEIPGNSNAGHRWEGRERHLLERKRKIAGKGRVCSWYSRKHGSKVHARSPHKIRLILP